MNKFRASFSTLSAWDSGAWQRAIESYFKLSEFSTKQMRAGKKLHEDFEVEIQKTSCMPKVFGAKPLIEPETELKIVKQLDDWLELVGVIDCYSDGVIYDWKTGVSTSESYAGSMQPRVYQILKPEAIRAEIHHYNQYNKKTDMSIIYLTDVTREIAKDWVITISSQMHSYFTENKLYERFQK